MMQDLQPSPKGLFNILRHLIFTPDLKMQLEQAKLLRTSRCAPTLALVSFDDTTYKVYHYELGCLAAKDMVCAKTLASKQKLLNSNAKHELTFQRKSWTDKLAGVGSECRCRLYIAECSVSGKPVIAFA